MRLVLGVGLAVVLAGLTSSQSSRWKNDRGLWCSAARLAPEKPRTLNNCALALMREGDYAHALPILQFAAVMLEEREPNRRQALRATVLTNQFIALYSLRQTDEARTLLNTLDQSDPRVQRFQTWFQHEL